MMRHWLLTQRRLEVRPSHGDCEPIVNHTASLHHLYRDAVWPVPQATSIRLKATIGYA